MVSLKHSKNSRWVIWVRLAQDRERLAQEKPMPSSEMNGHDDGDEKHHKRWKLTPLASLFCKNAECPLGPLPSIAFGNFAFNFASSNFSNSFG